jgi:hypothetical protein
MIQELSPLTIVFPLYFHRLHKYPTAIAQNTTIGAIVTQAETPSVFQILLTV